MIQVRRAEPTDAPSIGRVHVAAWRSTYPGILPQDYLAHLSAARQAAHYEATIRGGVGVFAALGGQPRRIVGFTSAAPCRRQRFADGEVETLYVLDDHREQGAGRALMAAAASHLAGLGCTSLFLWVLRDNPSKWFYARLGGAERAHQTIRIAGHDVVQSAYVWPDISVLMSSSSAPST